MIPLISFDALVNVSLSIQTGLVLTAMLTKPYLQVYLTILFLIPLMRLYTFKNHKRTPANIRLRTVAIRTFIGAIFTLTSSIV